MGDTHTLEEGPRASLRHIPLPAGSSVAAVADVGGNGGPTINVVCYAAGP